MLLQRLTEYGERIAGKLPAEFYREKQIHWVLDIGEDGRQGRLLHRKVPGRQRDQVVRKPVPYVQRSGTKVPPYLLVDTAEFALGIAKADKDGKVTDKAKDEAERRHEAYRELVLRWAETSDEPAAQAAQRFFSAGPVTFSLPEGVDAKQVEAKDTVAVMAGTRWLHELDSAQRLWAQEVRSRKGGAEERSGLCLVCGEHRALLATIPEPVKKGAVPTTGGSNEGQLISINAPAQGRDGATQLVNTPVCHQCGGRTMAVLNHLLASDRHRRRFRDDGVLLWWTRHGQDDSALAMFFDDQPEPAEIERLLDSPHTSPAPTAGGGLDTDAFYALSLGLNNARLVVRDWIDIPLPAARRNLAAWYEDHGVWDGWEGRTRYVPLWQMALACGRWLGERYAPKSAPHGLEPELLRSALHQIRPPARALPLLLQRVHADRRIDLPRLALLRLLLNRSPNPQDHLMPQLDKDSTDPAYRWGRLFAVLESVQHAALPDINTTLRDKFFSAASTAPASTMPRLYRDAGAHLKRLRRDKPAAAHALEARLDEIYEKVCDDLPGHLDDVQQGRFIIGYSHQRAEDRARRRAAKEAKEKTQRETKTADVPAQADAPQLSAS
ncbi:type I-C CRISPR-associated protein Cas8c/Csd1 [Streptomyces koyangensis]|uniref:type I-C CRISPR-associated protein Cas8c/Csd1 n=1 Tax=Streptomyces koyangensis TaxID=188770 RepID=UPI003BF51ADB